MPQAELKKKKEHGTCPTRSPTLDYGQASAAPPAPIPGGSSVGSALHEALSITTLLTPALTSSPCPQKLDYFCASTVILHSVYLCCVR